MPYKIEAGLWSSVFAVPAAVVDEHLKLCSPLALKTLLFLLRHGGQTFGATALAKKVGGTPDDVRDALAYWISVGIVAKTEVQPQKEPAQADLPAADAAPDAPQPFVRETENDRQKIVTISSRAKLTQDDVVRLSKNDATIAQLLREAQMILGAPLTPVESEIITALCAYYHMPYDVVLMLLQYCVSVGKRSMHAIEKRAAEWIERGIDTFERAEQEILRLAQAQENENKIIAAFGEVEYSLKAKEKATIAEWFSANTDEHLILLACEIAKENTGKVAVAYADKVLSRWKSDGIKTAQQAARALKEQAAPDKKKSAQNASAKTGGTSSIDMEKLRLLLHHQPDSDE